MKTINKTTCATGFGRVAALAVMSAPLLMAQTVVVQPPPPPPPASVTIQTPAPPPPPSVNIQTPVPAPAPGGAVIEGVPDYYVWDGNEYVGVVGNQYYYLAPGNVWMPLPQGRLVFFMDWEKHHHDWHKYAIVNDHYRIDSHGKVHPIKHHDHDHDFDH